MVLDVHTHIFPPGIIREREKFFEGEPEFRLLYESPKAKMATAEMLIDSMDRNGVDKSVVFGFPWRMPDHLKFHNEYVIRSAAGLSDRLIPLACLDLFAEECADYAASLIRDGFRGFGELAVYGASEELGCVMSNFREVARLSGASGLAILAHANEPVGHVYPGKAPFGLDFYYSLASAAGGTPLILAHWGGGLLFFELLKKEAPELLANVRYDTAASPYLYRKDVYRIGAQIAGPDKILFGSDFPLISPARYFEEIRDSGLPDSEAAGILGNNAARIFGVS
ncbi:MAG: amidohydrolase [Desulfobacteraceae bacterium]|nr:amidohydrolase [Desulfobacteraceae bacterium]